MSPSVTIRAAVVADLPVVVEMNRSVIPAVNEVDLAGFGWFLEVADRFLIAEIGGAVAGFVITVAHGVEHSSENYRWFAHHRDRFLYVDRIVVAEEHRGSGLGRTFYDMIVAEAANSFAELVAEVNTRPRNQGSLDFHERYGFVAIGEQETGGGAKEVLMLSLELDGSQLDVEPESAPVGDDVLELDRLEADVATVGRLLDRLSELGPGERSAMLDSLEASGHA